MSAQLAAGRVSLRRLRETDAPDFHQAFGDPEAMRFWDAPATRDVAETESRIRHSLSADPDEHAAFAVLLRDGCTFIGMVNYHARNTAHRRLGVGWILVPHYAGQGYMSEAMTALLSHCFGALLTHRVEAEIAAENSRSVRLAERLGFCREGLLRDRMQVGGVTRSMAMYGLLAPDWHALHPTEAQSVGATS